MDSRPQAEAEEVEVLLSAAQHLLSPPQLRERGVCHIAETVEQMVVAGAGGQLR